MDAFAPPPGPPPSATPKVPEGWKAQWNEQYKEWFYVNIYTKKSQWDKPTQPVYEHDAPPGPPPGYAGGSTASSGDVKHNPYDTDNRGPGGSSHDISADEALARKMQAEEDERVRNSSATRGNAMNDYANTPLPVSAQSYGQQDIATKEQKSKGLFSKLLGGKSSSGNQSSYGGQPSYVGGYGHQQYPPQQGYGGGYPQQGYGGYPPQQQYGGYPPQQGYGGGYQQRPQKSGGGGMGMMGGAALGLGAGVVGGMLLEDAIDDHQQEAYQDGYQDGQQDDYGGGGGDFDDGGGDF